MSERSFPRHFSQFSEDQAGLQKQEIEADQRLVKYGLAEDLRRRMPIERFEERIDTDILSYQLADQSIHTNKHDRLATILNKLVPASQIYSTSLRSGSPVSRLPRCQDFKLVSFLISSDI